ncbi:MAG: dihydropteroate synthase, partial [Alphaproteobacteria bacterium]
AGLTVAGSRSAANFSDIIPNIGEGAQIYLRPIGLERALEADCVEGEAGFGWRLSGGDAAFNRCQVLIRNGDEISTASARLTDVLDWSERQGAAHRDRITRLLHLLTVKRQPFAGLALDRPRIMGVINVTPDSFSDGGAFLDPRSAIRHGRALAAAGADILDIGGESTRPGASPVSQPDELGRVLPVIRGLADADAVLSIDSRKAGVMAAALTAGAGIINDVTALSFDPQSMSVAAESKAPVILMHSRGEPATMQAAPRYFHAPLDVYDELEARIVLCERAGIPRGRIAVDPGIGFAKTATHNVEILRALSLFHGLGCAVVLGASRKSFIGRIAGADDPERRLAGSLAVASAALDQGVQILRVHDVEETRQMVDVWRELNKTVYA